MTKRIQLTRRSFLGSLAAAAASSAALSACGGSGGAGSTSGGAGKKNLIIGMQQGSLRTFDPDLANEPEWLIIGKNMYDQLVTVHGMAYTKIAPALASSHSVSPDGLTYTFSLRPGVKFSDGSNATADDLIYSFNRINGLESDSYLIDGVSFKKTGANQVTLTLKQPNVDFLEALTNPSLTPVNSKLVAAHGGNDSAQAVKTDKASTWLNSHSVGTGPFVLDSWTQGVSVQLSRNPHYWGAKPLLDTVKFQFVSDQNTQTDLLAGGDIHVASGLTANVAASLANSSPNVAVKSGQALGLAYLGWSVTHHPVLRNPDVWDALKYAIDYEGLAGVYLKGGEPIGSCIPPGLPGALPASEGMSQNLTRAKAALAKAGVPGGFSFTLTYGSDAIYTSVPAQLVAQKIAADLARVGIKVNLHPVLESEMITEYRAGKPEAVLHWWQPQYAGWTSFLPEFGPGGNPGLVRQQWGPGFSAQAKALADVIAKAQRTADSGAQASLCMEAQRQMNASGPYAWLFATHFLTGVRTDVVKRLDLNPTWYFDLNTAQVA